MASARGTRLDTVTGGAFLVGGLGVVWDAFAHDPAGTWGLIPAYLGMTVGIVTFPWLMARRAGWVAAAIAALGAISSLVFWYSYPLHAAYGGFGGILTGIAVLWLPFPGRFAAALWVAAGVTGIPAVVRAGQTWGPLSAFMLTGLALSLTGAHLLWVRSGQPVE